jgi:hypothetical protein
MPRKDLAAENASTDESVDFDRISIDLSGVDSPYGTLADGNYDLIIGDAELRKSKSSGKPMLVVRYDHQDEESGETNFINDYLLLDQRRAQFRIRQLLKASGQKPVFTPSAVAGLVGTELPNCEVTLEESEDFGKSNRVRSLDIEL